MATLSAEFDFLAEVFCSVSANVYHVIACIMFRVVLYFTCISPRIYIKSDLRALPALFSVVAVFFQLPFLRSYRAIRLYMKTIESFFIAPDNIRSQARLPFQRASALRGFAPSLPVLLHDVKYQKNNPDYTAHCQIV